MKEGKRREKVREEGNEVEKEVGEKRTTTGGLKDEIDYE